MNSSSSAASVAVRQGRRVSLDISQCHRHGRRPQHAWHNGRGLGTSSSLTLTANDRALIVLFCSEIRGTGCRTTHCADTGSNKWMRLGPPLFQLTGRSRSENVEAIGAQFETCGRAAIDLAEVTMVDLEAMRFLSA